MNQFGKDKGMGVTPLFIASLEGHTEVVQCLLERKWFRCEYESQRWQDSQPFLKKMIGK
jgi:ankyrin repeat protein